MFVSPFPFIKKSRSSRGLCDRESTQRRFPFWGGPFFDSRAPNRHSSHSGWDSEASALTGPQSTAQIGRSAIQALGANGAFHCALDPFKSTQPREHPTSVHINTYQSHWAAGGLGAAKVQLEKHLTHNSQHRTRMNRASKRKREIWSVNSIWTLSKAAQKSSVQLINKTLHAVTIEARYFIFLYFLNQL